MVHQSQSEPGLRDDGRGGRLGEVLQLGWEGEMKRIFVSWEPSGKKGRWEVAVYDAVRKWRGGLM